MYEMSEVCTMLVTVLLAALATTEPSTAIDIPGLDPELSPPVRIEAGGKPIDTDIGHAAPFVGDIDGDGVPDLLVGQFGEGKLCIYHNDGTATAPKLAAGQFLKIGADLGRVPSG
jgi:hypothetical protein